MYTLKEHAICTQKKLESAPIVDWTEYATVLTVMCSWPHFSYIYTSKVMYTFIIFLT